jgi:large subunit ribosomal protein L50
MGGIKNFNDQKFELLSKCSAAFGNHYVPNSQLFEIKSLEDVMLFYETKVDTRTPYQQLDTNDTPNLHVIQDYKRYDPDEDGVSAFPRSSTLVTGLKTRKKYKGHQAKMSYP